MLDPLAPFIIIADLWLVYTTVLLLLIWGSIAAFRTVRRTLHTTALRGPPHAPVNSADIAACAVEYGPVFPIRTGLFSKTIVLCDSAAIAHFYARSPVVYRTPDATRRSTRNLVGRGLAWVDGKRHPHYRKVLAPMFSGSAVEGYSPIFFDMAKKVQLVWNQALESRPRGMVVDIQHWMNCIVLDSLGTAGFGHDFDSISGAYCPTTAAFYALRAPCNSSLADKIFRLAWRASRFPVLRRIPTARNRILNDFQARMRQIAGDVLERHSSKDGPADWSFIGLLIKSLAEDPAGEFRLSHPEVLAQLNTWLFSGFETTAASLSWVFIELARNPTVQEKLRTELRQLNRTQSADYREISALPYLQAVVYETLRLHPAVCGTTRVAAQDDIIPLSAPLITKAGTTVNSISVGSGTAVTVPICSVSTSAAHWGPGAAAFDPERWWHGHAPPSPSPAEHASSAASAAAAAGYQHLAFGDGPRACVGAELALALMKVVLFVFVQNYSVALLDGPQTEIEAAGEPVSRPRVAGRGTELLMVIRGLEVGSGF